MKILEIHNASARVRLSAQTLSPSRAVGVSPDRYASPTVIDIRPFSAKKNFTGPGLAFVESSSMALMLTNRISSIGSCENLTPPALKASITRVNRSAPRSLASNNSNESGTLSLLTSRSASTITASLFPSGIEKYRITVSPRYPILMFLKFFTWYSFSCTNHPIASGDHGHVIDRIVIN